LIPTIDRRRASRQRSPLWGRTLSIRQSCVMLAINPFGCRKVGEGVFVRELIVPFGATGFVAMFEIQNAETVRIGSIRHQRESDYH
jgi:hypothetical protein